MSNDDPQLRHVEIEVRELPGGSFAEIEVHGAYFGYWYKWPFDPEDDETREEYEEFWQDKHVMPALPARTLTAAGSHLVGIIARVAALGHQFIESKHGHRWNHDENGHASRPHRACTRRYAMTVEGADMSDSRGLTNARVEFQFPAKELDEWIERVEGWVTTVVAATQPSKSPST